MTWAEYWQAKADQQNGGAEPEAPEPAQSERTAYLSDPVGYGPPQGDPSNPNYGQPIETHYNNTLFATDDAAQKLAQQYGGKVVQAPLREAGGGTPGSPFDMPNSAYIQMPNGAMVNAGTLLQYQQNFPPDVAAKMIQQEIAGDTQQGLANQGATGLNDWQKQYGGGALPTSAGPNPGGSGAAAGPVNTGGPAATPNTGGGNQQQPRTRTPAAGDGSELPRSTAPAAKYLGGYGNAGGYFQGPDGKNAAAVPAPGGGNGAIGGYYDDTGKWHESEWGYNPSNNVGDILGNDRKFAYAQGQKLIGNYGDMLAGQDQRARTLGAAGDDLYAWMLANPGYTETQARDIMNQQGLDGLDWTRGMADSNFLKPTEELAINGDPYKSANTYKEDIPGLQKNVTDYQGNLEGIYNKGAGDLGKSTGNLSTALHGAIDPQQLGLSDEYRSRYSFGPEDEQALVEDAGRTVGQGTAAVTDQLQRQANAAGTNAPLAMAAALDRERQTGAVASADAMTKARIQAKQLGLNTEQTKEQTRLGTAQDVSSREMDAAKTVGAQDEQNQQFLTSGRANAGLQTGAAAIQEGNTIAGTRQQLAGQGEVAAQQRAQAIAQNRQQINQTNQNSQFTRGSYQDQAKSQRATQIAGAQRSDLTAARQDVRNEELTANNESNSRMAGQLQAFGGTTGAGQASQQNAITASQLPTTLNKVVQAATNGAGAAEGGIFDKPTLTRIGEMGPEIIIKLKPSNGGAMNYRRRNEAAYA